MRAVRLANPKSITISGVGYSFPEISQYSLSDLRVRQEICTGNYLVNHDDDGDGQRDQYSIAAVKEEYPCATGPFFPPTRLSANDGVLAALGRQSNVAFTGYQASGLYRSWPGLYQCLTENTCSGCSDIRFRGWYASAASGAKDVVIVIDTSGSMGSANRMEHTKMAASWIINTLSETDYAMVVQFNSGASSEASRLIQ